MASIKVLGLRGSLRTRAVLATLEELALPYEFVTIDFAKMKSQEFLAKQPWGKVPVLEDGSDFQLYESRAIIRYLVNAYDRTGALYPAEPKARAVVDQWISIEQSYYVVANELIGELFFGPMSGKTANEAKVKDLEVQLAKVLEVMDKHLSKSKFIGGDRFTIAGTYFFTYGALFVLVFI